MSVRLSAVEMWGSRGSGFAAAKEWWGSEPKDRDSGIFHYGKFALKAASKLRKVGKGWEEQHAEPPQGASKLLSSSWGRRQSPTVDPRPRFSSRHRALRLKSNAKNRWIENEKMIEQGFFYN